MQETWIQARLKQFENVCRQKGVPVTMQRRAILEAVLQRDDHPTAEHIYETVRQRIPQLSRTTVYRVLDALAELGLVRRLHHTGTARFDGNMIRHHHLVCTQCGTILDMEDEALDQLSLPDQGLQGFAIDDFSIYFTGTCPDCRKQKE